MLPLIAGDTAAQLSGVAGWMTTLIDALGPIGVGIVILIETVFPPIPSEVVLPAAGYLAGIGQLGWWWTLLWATIGSVVGAWTLYGVGALVGADRIGRVTARLPLMSEHDVERAWTAFDRWRSPVVFWGRLIPGVRSLVSLPAGAQRMPLGRFTLLTALGSAIWNAALLAAGWWLGDRYGATAAVSHWANIAVLAGAVAFVAWFTARRIRDRRGRARRHTARLVVPAVIVVVVLAIVALQPNARTWVGFWLTDHIGAPPTGEPFASFDAASTPTQRFAVAGDVGTGDDVEQRSADAMDLVEGELDYDALLLLGDNVYPNGDPSAVPRTVFEPFDAVLDGGTELVAVLGNHDVRDGNGDAQATALGMPARWYSQRIGDVLVIALDSTQPDNPDQVAWLQATLREAPAPWTIALLHHPPYSGGYHGSDLAARAQFAPLFTEFGVDLVLSGHDHDYQRTSPIDGVTYVVTGAAAKLRPTDLAEFTAAAWSTNSFVDLAVYDDHIELRAIDQAGRIFDQVTIEPVDPAR